MRFIILAIVFAIGPVSSQRVDPDSLQRSRFDLEAFVEHMRSLGSTSRQLETLRVRASAGAEPRAVDDLLRSRFPDYGDAVRLAEKRKPRAALELAKVLQTNRDRYVRGLARYQLGRVLLEGDDPEAAAAVFEDFLRQDWNHTPHDGEALYFHGLALAMIPERARAVRILGAFLRSFLAAPKRMRSSAAQVKTELEQQEGALHAISDVMGGVRRDLRRTHTGDAPQRKQRDVIDQLQRLIEMWEKQESGGGAGAPGGSPARDSALPEGSATAPKLGGASGKTFERWDTIRPAEREAIELELRTKLPARYRKMLKSYYRRMGRSQR